ncbi:translation initiation factor eIF2B subunit delta [Bacillus rossius redtenbacheri]|uniref:translation initiation factor eIF2B subunit delta n=1 Tax=Bacillus rossius redtenbacheri TaxID=93214 RepID=UPI002FDD46A8
MPAEEADALAKKKAEARAEKKAQKAARAKKAAMRDQAASQVVQPTNGPKVQESSTNTQNSAPETKPSSLQAEAQVKSTGVDSSAQKTQNATLKVQNATPRTQKCATKTVDNVQKAPQKQLKSAPVIKAASTKAVKIVSHQQTVKPKDPVQQNAKLFVRLSSVKKSVIEPVPQNFPPSFARLVVQFSDGIVVGSNARCVAFMEAARQLIENYETPAEKTFSRGLEETLQSCSEFLLQCRPVSISIRNASKFLKWQVLHLPDEPEEALKARLYKAIESYTWEQVELADRAISGTVKRKIVDGDVVVVYGCSSIVQRIIEDAHRGGADFRVVVVDGRPWTEGKELLRRIVAAGVKCSYVLVTAASFAMMEATKVLLGAHSLLSNGSAITRAGASQVAMLAHACNVPVLMCCETHKFSEGAHTDAFCREELVADSDASAIVYDIMPPDFVTAVVTEVAVVPCTSVPVILRVSA